MTIDTTAVYQSELALHARPLPVDAAAWPNITTAVTPELVADLDRSRYARLSEGQQRAWRKARRDQHQAPLRLGTLPGTHESTLIRLVDELRRAMRDPTNPDVFVLAGATGSGRTQMALEALIRATSDWKPPEDSELHRSVEIPVMAIPARSVPPGELPRSALDYLRYPFNPNGGSAERIVTDGLREAGTGIVFIDDIDACGVRNGQKNDVAAAWRFVERIIQATSVAVLVTARTNDPTTPIASNPYIASHRTSLFPLDPLGGHTKRSHNAYLFAVAMMASQYALLDEPAELCDNSIEGCAELLHEYTDGNLAKTRKALRWAAMRHDRDARGTETWKSWFTLSHTEKTQLRDTVSA